MSKINPLTIVLCVFLLGMMVLNLPHKAKIEAVSPIKPVEAEYYNYDICGLDAVVCEDENAEAIIRKVAKEYGVSEEKMLALAKCESQLGQMMVGDTNLPKPSYGLFQINLYFHPNITKEQAMDYEWSAKWTAEQIKAGRGNLWSCWSKV